MTDGQHTKVYAYCENYCKVEVKDKATVDAEQTAQDNRLTALETAEADHEGRIVILENDKITGVEVSLLGLDLTVKIIQDDGDIIQDTLPLPIANKIPIIKFTNYTGSIPLSEGCQYSTDGASWTVAEGTELMNVSNWSGWVKFNTIVTGSGYSERTNELEYLETQLTDREEYNNPLDIFVFKMDDVVYTIAKSNFYTCNAEGVQSVIPTSFNWNEGAYGELEGKVLLGSANAYKFIDSELIVTNLSNGSSGWVKVYFSVLDNKVFSFGGRADEVIDSEGIITTIETRENRTGYLISQFVLGGKVYACGGGDLDGGTVSAQFPTTNAVSVYDSELIKTTGTPLRQHKKGAVGVTLNDRGFVIGGDQSQNNTSVTTVLHTVDIYDINGNRSNGTNVPYPPRYGIRTPFEYKGNEYVMFFSGSTNYNLYVMDANNIFTDSGIDYQGNVEGNRLETISGNVIISVNPYKTWKKIDVTTKWDATFTYPFTEFTDYIIDDVEAIATGNGVTTLTKTHTSQTDPELHWDYQFKYENGNIIITEE